MKGNSDRLRQSSFHTRLVPGLPAHQPRAFAAASFSKSQTFYLSGAHGSLVCVSIQYCVVVGYGAGTVPAIRKSESANRPSRPRSAGCQPAVSPTASRQPLQPGKSDPTTSYPCSNFPATIKTRLDLGLSHRWTHLSRCCLDRQAAKPVECEVTRESREIPDSAEKRNDPCWIR
jgi:hypothetical protein